MVAIDHTPETGQDKSRTRYTPVDDFRRQFQSLVDDRVCFELVGRLPAGKQNGPEMRQEVNVYYGTDWSDAFEQALKWNCKGYNVLFAPTNTKGCLDFEWLGLSAISNRSLINIGVIAEHALDMNRREFDGKANVVDAGDRFWFLIRLPNQTARPTIEPSQLRRCIRWYCTNLGLKWNIVTRVVLPFHVDDVDFFPGMNMPAVGLLNHDLDPPCRITCINDHVKEPQSDILIRILETKDPVREVMTHYSNLDSSSIIRKLSILNINPVFTENSLDRLLETDIVARKMFKDDCRSGKDGNGIEVYVGRLIFLRTYLHASVNVIERILRMTGGFHTLGPGHPSGYERTDLLRAIVAADEYTRPIWGNIGNTTMPKSDNTGSTMDILSLSTLNPTIPYDKAIIRLSQRYGPQIYPANSGLCVVRINKTPQEIVCIRDRIFRTRSYMPVPCSFWVAENELFHGEGALLVPIDAAACFWDTVILDKLKGHMAAIYFWYHGKNFELFKIPAESIDFSHDIVEQVHEIARYQHPGIMRRMKEHLLDRNRKYNPGINIDQ